MEIQVTYTGRSYQSASRLPAVITLEENATVADALEHIHDGLSEDEQLPASCLVAVSGEHIGTLTSHSNPSLKDRDELVLIAPVAGG